MHQITFDNDYEKSAVAHVVASLLADPAYKTLRTQEQLGYAIKLTKDSILKTININLIIQSNKYNCDHLEYRINEFFWSRSCFTD